MNKIVLGSALVEVMGGVPGATYLLTREEKTTTVEADVQGPEEECVPNTTGKDCTKTDPAPVEGKGQVNPGPSTPGAGV